MITAPLPRATPSGMGQLSMIIPQYYGLTITYRISSNSFRGIYSFQVLPAAATKRGRLLNEGGYY